MVEFVARDIASSAFRGWVRVRVWVMPCVAGGFARGAGLPLCGSGPDSVWQGLGLWFRSEGQKSKVT